MHKLNRLAGRVGDNLQSLVLLLIRLYWGWSFFQTGKGKLMNLDRTAQFFATLPYVQMAPKLNAIMAGGVECLGGLLLLLGLWSRVITLPLICVMVVAYLTAESDAVHAIFSNPDKFTGADPFLYLLAAVIVFVFGPGRVSVDALIARKSASA